MEMLPGQHRGSLWTPTLFHTILSCGFPLSPVFSHKPLSGLYVATRVSDELPSLPASGCIILIVNRTQNPEAEKLPSVQFTVLKACLFPSVPDRKRNQS